MGKTSATRYETVRTTVHAPSPPIRPKKLYCDRSRIGRWLGLLAGVLGLGLFVGQAKADQAVKTGEPGPWGLLETYEIRLVPPLSYATAALKNENRDTAWRFVSETRESVAAKLINAGLAEIEVQRLLDSGISSQNERWFEVNPPVDLLLGLDPGVRKNIYELLKPDPLNPLYRFPYVLDPHWYDESVSHDGVAPEVIDLIRKVSYFQESVPVVSDVPLVMSMIPSPEGKLSLMREMLNERSLAVRLRVNRDTDLEELSAYWSAGGRSKEILPVLRSVMETEGVERLDLVHVLPPLPRMLLYTYSSPQMAVGMTRPDCFWTAANFFNQSPSNRFLDFSAFEKYIGNRCEEVTGQGRKFGDVVLIIDEDSGDFLHACNYLADDLVYTKNGRSFSRPWIVDSLESVMAGYLKVPNVSVRTFRQKILSPLSP